jgi:predicted protein tyrosine phosphatase
LSRLHASYEAAKGHLFNVLYCQQRIALYNALHWRCVLAFSESQRPRHTTPAKRPPLPLSWVQVVSGRLALWGCPGIKSFLFLREAGCTRVVTLLSEKEGGAAIGEQATKAQLAWTWIPLPGRTPPSGEARVQVLSCLAQFSTYLDQGESLLIHCSAGIHRTGMVTYALLRCRGVSGDEAREVLTRLRQHTAEGMPQSITRGAMLPSDAFKSQASGTHTETCHS